VVGLERTNCLIVMWRTSETFTVRFQYEYDLFAMVAMVAMVSLYSYCSYYSGVQMASCPSTTSNDLRPPTST